MPTERTERLVNLVLALLSTRQYLTAEHIRSTVSGYGDTASDEAFFRMFERDKAELRELGIPLETGRGSAFDTVDGYRIARRDYELGEVALEPDEAAAVGLAVRLWDSPKLADAARGALVKLRAAGVEVDPSELAAVQPHLRTEPAFEPMLRAVQDVASVQFTYRRGDCPQRAVRTVEPWGVVSWRGRWYVVGHDRDREAVRCFRLSRVHGDVRKLGAASTPREEVDLLGLVAGAGEAGGGAAISARLWVAEGAAAGIRREATVLGPRALGQARGEELAIELAGVESAARWVAGYGPDVLVLEPEAIAEAVRERLERVAREGVEA